jgi:hypothetical protein
MAPIIVLKSGYVIWYLICTLLLQDIGMNTISTQSEILLMKGTTFSKREWCGDNAVYNSTNYLTREQMLEEASCWSGLLNELVPEILNNQDENEKLFLWLIRQGQAFVQLELCREPLIIEREFSLDPYLFLSAQINN